ncbi:elongation factor P [bacterium]|nr:elongation factor P [bacterium]
MLDYSEIKPKKIILLDGEPYVVLDSHVFRMQQRKPVNQTKLRHLITGKVTERSFHQSESVHEADISTRKVKFLYNHRGEFMFCEEKDPSKRFPLSEDLLGNGAKFLKSNTLVDAVEFDEKIIGINLPIKMELKVTEAPPGIKGDTAQGGTKQVVLETGATLNAPLFINEGDVIRINTESGEYVERVDKK